MRVLGIVVVVFYILCSASSCSEDYKESGIEGQWRLHQIKSPDGKVFDVDTVFYSFKKDVFRYLKLKTDIQTFSCYGNYSQAGDKLIIEIIRDSFEPKDDEGSLDWNQLTRSFTIRKHTSSVLELDYEGDIYYLGKY